MVVNEKYYVKNGYSAEDIRRRQEIRKEFEQIMSRRDRTVQNIKEL